MKFSTGFAAIIAIVCMQGTHAKCSHAMAGEAAPEDGYFWIPGSGTPALVATSGEKTPVAGMFCGRSDCVAAVAGDVAPESGFFGTSEMEPVSVTPGEKAPEAGVFCPARGDDQFAPPSTGTSADSRQLITFGTDANGNGGGNGCKCISDVCVRCDNPADDTPAEKLATVTDQTKAMLKLFFGFEVPAPGGGEAAETSADSKRRLLRGAQH